MVPRRKLSALLLDRRVLPMLELLLKVVGDVEQCCWYCLVLRDWLGHRVFWLGYISVMNWFRLIIVSCCLFSSLV